MAHVVAPNPKNFVIWDSGSPLQLPMPSNIWPTIPTNTLKDIPKKFKEDFKVPSQHLQDIAEVCRVHNIVEENIALTLLATSLKGKYQDWY